MFISNSKVVIWSWSWSCRHLWCTLRPTVTFPAAQHHGP